jgi:hypothetical protein
VVDGAGAADEVLELVVEGFEESRVGAAGVVGRAQFVERVHQRLGDEDAAVGAEMTVGVWQIVRFHSIGSPQGRDFSLWVFLSS